MVSAFRGIIEFFDNMGLYDVVLPFLLVFAIVFAILEKTKVFGMEKIDGKPYTRKNINAIVAFVIAFLVVASSQLVDILTTVSSYTVILLMVSVLFLLLIGSFLKEGEGVFLEGGWKVFFMIIMFIGIVLIFLSAIKDESGDSWLETGWSWLSGGSTSNAVGSIVLLIIIILFMAYIIKEPHRPGGSKETKKE
jgi:hypothetical membrane protein